jgi:hypothetical protein
VERMGIGTLWLPGQRIWGRVSYRVHQEDDITVAARGLSGHVRAMDLPGHPDPFADLVGRPVHLRLATGEWWHCEVIDAQGTLRDRGGFIPAGPWPRPHGAH